MKKFRALVVDKTDDGVSLSIQEWQRGQLLEGEVTIRVEYSSINFKDALAARADGRVARRYPLVPGIDLAGVVAESTDDRFRPGDRVLAHGYEIGVSHHGGFAELARVPAGWVAPMPSDLTTRQAMAIGTGGFTAAMSVAKLEELGLRPDQGPVVVTGASGGVGSTAVDILASRGYHVVASTGSADALDYLRKLGAKEVVGRDETSAPSQRPLESMRWAGAVDAVGGDTLAYLLRTMQVGASVAACGNTGGAALNSTVFPFILRGVNLLGMDSGNMPIDRRITMWERVACDLRPPHLEEAIAHEIELEQIPDALQAIYGGRVQGRIVVKTDGHG